mgnify:CR=1 FL=1
MDGTSMGQASVSNNMIGYDVEDFIPNCLCNRSQFNNGTKKRQKTRVVKGLYFEEKFSVILVVDNFLTFVVFVR